MAWNAAAQQLAAPIAWQASFHSFVATRTWHTNWASEGAFLQLQLHSRTN